MSGGYMKMVVNLGGLWWPIEFESEMDMISSVFKLNNDV